MNNIVKCVYCNKEFELSKIQLARYLKDPTRHNFCSKSCSALFNKNTNKNIKRNQKGQFVKKEYLVTASICTNCGKQFKLSKMQQKRLEKEDNPNLFCSKSCSAKYSNAHRTNEWKTQSEKTSMYKYGEKHYVNKNQISKTLKEYYKHNNNYGFNSEKYKQIMVNKYGVDNISKSDWIKDYNLKTYGTEYFFQSETYKNCMESKFNSIEDYHSRVSKANIEIIQQLKDRHLNCTIEKYIRPYYYDICCNKNLIEIDPTITHNVIFNIFGKEPVDKMYHYNKTEIAKNAGYNCIHIFDWDNKDKIINMLDIKTNIYARMCNIKEINSNLANEFLNKYHLQSSCNGNIVNIGLFYNRELLQIMTFGKPRYNKNYEWELLRLCTKFRL